MSTEHEGPAIGEGAFEASPNPILVHDAETGAIVGANAAAADLLGRSRAALRGSDVGELTPPGGSLQDDLSSLLERVRTEGTGTAEWQLSGPDGEPRSVEVELRADGEDRVLSFLSPATDRPGRERRRDQQHEHLETVVEHMPVVLFALDPDGRFTLSRGSALDRLGLEPGELDGASVFDVYADTPEIISAVERALDGEHVRATQSVGDLSFDTLYRPVVEDGEVQHVIGVSLDVTEQVERERRLEENEAILRQLTRTTDDVFWLFDADFTETLFVNDAYEEVWGRSIEDLRADAMDFMEGVHPEDREHVAEVIERLRNGESTETEYRVNPEEEFGRWVSVKGEPIFDESGEVVRAAGFARDITERKAREERLERSERQFDAVFNDPGALVGVLDPDGTVLRVNETALELVDVDRSTIRGTAFAETPWWRHDEALQADLREWVRRAADGEYVTFEAEHPGDEGETMTVEGSLRPVTDENGAVVSLVASARDITARTRREAQLEALSEATERLALAQTPDEVAERVVEIASEVLEQPVTALWCHDDEDGGRLAPWAASGEVQRLGERTDGLPTMEPGTAEMDTFRDGSPRYIPDYRGLDDSAHPEDALGSLLLFPVGDYGLLGVGSPATDAFGDAERNLLAILASNAETAFRRAEREQALETYKNKLEESNENLQEFAYIASHDLQEPLRSVTSYLDLIETEYHDALDEDGRFYIERAETNASRMSAMIDALLQYSRVETEGSSFETVDAGAVLSDTIDGLAVLVEESGAEIRTGDLPTVTADGDQLGQLFQNLIENAIEHGADPPTVEVSARDAGDAWEFTVADDGPGIPEQHHDRVFEIFQQATTDDDKGEAGIGLAICERIVSRHHGDIWVESDGEDGARFKFTIPKDGTMGEDTRSPTREDR
jgi:PAS domain S-box-containing protein